MIRITHPGGDASNGSGSPPPGSPGTGGAGAGDADPVFNPAMLSLYSSMFGFNVVAYYPPTDREFREAGRSPGGEFLIVEDELGSRTFAVLPIPGETIRVGGLPEIPTDPNGQRPEDVPPPQAQAGRVIAVGGATGAGRGAQNSVGGASRSGASAAASPAAGEPSRLRFVTPPNVGPDVLTDLLALDYNSFRARMTPGTRDWNVFAEAMVHAVRSDHGFSAADVSRPGLFSRQTGINCQSQSIVHFVNIARPEGRGYFQNPTDAGERLNQASIRRLRRAGEGNPERASLDVLEAVRTLEIEHGIEVNVDAESMKSQRGLVSDHTSTLVGSYEPSYGISLVTQPREGIGHARLLLPALNPTREHCYWLVDSLGSPIVTPCSADQVLRWRLADEAWRDTDRTNFTGVSVMMRVLRFPKRTS